MMFISGEVYVRFHSSLHQDIRLKPRCFADMHASSAARALTSHAAAIGIRMHTDMRF
jgi:hypothetical protein